MLKYPVGSTTIIEYFFTYNVIVKSQVWHIADFQNEKGWEAHKYRKFRCQNRRIQNKRAAKGSFKFIYKISKNPLTNDTKTCREI